jgi:UDP-3-O-[3-hydroxymyristoyl] glucosamine N-acyltransferase
MMIAPTALRDYADKQKIPAKGPTPKFALTGVKPLDSAGESDIAFCRFEGDEGLNYVQNTKAAVVFVPESLVEALPDDRSYLLPCKHPRFEILRVLKQFWIEPEWDFDPAHNPCIHADAKIADGVRIGPFTVIGPDVVIGAGSRIGSNCRIEHAEIGRSVSIANNVVIGGVGFGYEDDPETKEVVLFPHIGGVLIGDRVDIGNNTCVDRGSIGDTIIGDDSKIDNLVHIAHNVRMGRRCKVIALAIVGGSVVLLDDVWIAPAAAIRDWRTIGKGAIVGLGAVVTKNVADGDVMVGNPAKPIKRTTHRYK